MTYLNTFTSPRVKASLKLINGSNTNILTIVPATPSAARTLNIIDPGGTDDFIFAAAAQVLGNKTLSTNLAASGFKVTGLADPTNPQDAATKAYVDAGALGLDIHNAVHLATTAALPANTYSSGGKTLTATSNGALTIDGIAATAGDRVLVKNEATQKNNGIYTVTNAGSGGAAYVLTRAADFDSTSEVDKLTFVLVEAGTANAGTGWTSPFSTTVVLDTDAIVWTQFNAGTGYSGTTNRITVSGGAIDISSSYVGQTSITTVGTIGTGTWQGTAIAPAYLGLSAGTGINSISGGTIAINTSVVMDLSTSQTATNKTFTSPILNTPKIKFTVRAADLSAGGSDTVATTDSYVDITTGTTANASVVLPAPSGNSGLVVTITKVDSGSGTILVSAASGTVSGATLIEIQNEAVTYRCDGTLWRAN